MREKEARLREIIRETGGLLVAYSGGVDSALVLKIASQELGSGALGVLGVSGSLAPGEREHALETARAMGTPVMEVEPDEFSDPEYLANPPERCYFCKRALMKEILAVARNRGAVLVADGFNADDWKDIRPGQEAAREAGVRSPLAEAGFAKEEVRELARELGIPVWDRPATPCLASRIPYGTPVSRDVLERIARAEEIIRSLIPGVGQVRVRHFGERALVQVDSGRVADLMARTVELSEALLAAGYSRVDIDPAGYRRGYLNEPTGVRA